MDIIAISIILHCNYVCKQIMIDFLQLHRSNLHNFILNNTYTLLCNINNVSMSNILIMCIATLKTSPKSHKTGLNEPNTLYYYLYK